MKNEILTDRIQKLVTALAIKIAYDFHCTDLANDFAQEAYLTLLLAAKSYNPEQGSFVNYAYRVATHAIYKALRLYKQVPFVSLDEYDTPEDLEYDTFAYESCETAEFVDTNPTPSERYEKADTLAKVREMVETLPENDYNLISELYGFDNLYERTYSQLAEKLEHIRTVEGVRKAERRILKGLKVKLSHQQYSLCA